MRPRFRSLAAPLALSASLIGLMALAVRAQQAAPQSPPASVSPPPAAAPVTLTPEDMMERAKKARELTRTYSERLRLGLTEALKQGGPKGAIGACHTLAPELNVRTTEESTFEIARTALRVRNPDNTPDAWELTGLELFQKRLAAGEDHRTMELFEVQQTREGQSIFRYMRPIVMHEPCLACHGPQVAADVKSEIAQYYPDDKAVGFNLNELRGAFTLVQQLD